MNYCIDLYNRVIPQRTLFYGFGGKVFYMHYSGLIGIDSKHLDKEPNL